MLTTITTEEEKKCLRIELFSSYITLNVQVILKHYWEPELVKAYILAN